jgi:hypothetical protein
MNPLVPEPPNRPDLLALSMLMVGAACGSSDAVAPQSVGGATSSIVSADSAPPGAKPGTKLQPRPRA